MFLWVSIVVFIVIFVKIFRSVVFVTIKKTNIIKVSLSPCHRCCYCIRLFETDSTFRKMFKLTAKPPLLPPQPPQPHKNCLTTSTTTVTNNYNNHKNYRKKPQPHLQKPALLEEASQPQSTQQQPHQPPEPLQPQQPQPPQPPPHNYHDEALIRMDRSFFVQAFPL